MMKDILVHIPTERPPRPVIDGSISLALTYGAHLDALAVGYVSMKTAFAIDGAPSTKAAAATIAKLQQGKKLLVVLARTDETSWLSLRNLAAVHVLAWDQLNAYDVLVADDVVFTKAAYDEFVATQSKEEVNA